MSKRKVTEIVEDKLVAEIYRKVRDRDGRRFYDTVIQRRYFVNEIEHRTPFYQLMDMDSMHILVVKVRRFIKDQLWQNRDSGNARDARPEEAEPEIDDLETESDESYVEE